MLLCVMFIFIFTMFIIQQFVTSIIKILLFYSYILYIFIVFLSYIIILCLDEIIKLQLIVMIHC